MMSGGGRGKAVGAGVDAGGGGWGLWRRGVVVAGVLSMFFVLAGWGTVVARARSVTVPDELRVVEVTHVARPPLGATTDGGAETSEGGEGSDGFAEEVRDDPPGSSSPTLAAPPEAVPIDGEFSREVFEAMCPGRVPRFAPYSEIYDLAATLAGVEVGGDGWPTSMEKLNPYRQPKGGYSVDLDDATSLVYMRIWKCANNNMRCFGTALDALNTTSGFQTQEWGKMEPVALRKQAGGKKALMFSLLREPLGHYLSGFNEMLFRRQDEVNKPFSKCYVPAFDGLAHSSPEKFREFVRQGFASPSAIKLKCWGFDGGWAHVFPMANVLGFTKPDPMDVLFMDISDAETSPQLLREHFGLTEAQLGIDTVDSNCGQHPTSNDPLGSYDASKAVAQDPDDRVTDAVCLLLIYDYACFPQYYLQDSRCKRAFDRHREALEGIVRPHLDL